MTNAEFLSTQADLLIALDILRRARFQFGKFRDRVVAELQKESAGLRDTTGMLVAVDFNHVLRVVDAAEEFYSTCYSIPRKPIMSEVNTPQRQAVVNE